MIALRLCWKQLVLAVVLLAFACERAQAHFVWVYKGDGKIQIVFGESLQPDQARFLGGLNDMRVERWSDGRFVAAMWEQRSEGDDGWFEISAEELPSAVNASCLYGVFDRGDSPMLLNYGAKYIDMTRGTAPAASKQMRLDLVPSFKDGRMQIQSFFDGEPIEGVEIQITQLAGETATLLSDSRGLAEFEGVNRFQIRAKHSLEEKGTHDGQSFQRKQFYCTLVLDCHASSIAGGIDTSIQESQEANSIAVVPVGTQIADFPQGMTSFGAANLDGEIFVRGGKRGRAHSYARSYQNRQYFKLDVAKEAANWEVASERVGLQGLAVVADTQGKRLIEIGGLEARNAEGEDQDLHSTDEVFAFHPETGQWTELPALPQPRSSHDACIHNGMIYVAGGWTLSGDSDAEWRREVLALDLAKIDEGWQLVSTLPESTRANAIGIVDGKLVVAGGIRERGGTSNNVHVYDISKDAWKPGSELPAEGSMKAFGCACMVLDNQFLVSCYDGGIYRLAGDNSWEKLHQLETGRFFHRMVPTAGNQFMILGGAHMEEGRIQEIEVFELKTGN